MQLHQLNRLQREALLEKVLTLFQRFCQKEMGKSLYPYQIRIAEACLSSLLVERKDVFIKIARQSGKTEAITLLLKFLLIFLLHLLGRPLMAAVASPNGEQAKTDVDRLKKDIQKLRERWQLEDRENNAHTIRAFRHDVLHGEVFRFSLAPTTHNESKTLNVLVIEEAHKINDQKRRDEMDPMLVSTGGVTWFIGVGCTQLCDFMCGCDGQLPGARVVVPVDEVIRDRRMLFGQTGDPGHLAYEHKFEEELRKYGSANPELRRNYYLDDQVEAGNFISRERFVSCARPEWQRKNGILIPVEDLTLAIDWGRVSDATGAGLMTRNFDLQAAWKYPRERYERQIEMILTDLKTKRKCLKTVADKNGIKEVEEEFTYFDRISTVRRDSNGIGDFPMEYLQEHSGLPVGQESLVKFTLESKNEMYATLEAALFRDAGDPLRFGYWQGEALAGEIEEQMSILLREYKTDRQLLSPHAPEKPGAHDDAPTMLALDCLGAATGRVGDILFV